jgi:hypothetical protein
LVNFGTFLVFSHTPISLFCSLLFLVRNNQLKQENFCSLEFIVLSTDSKIKAFRSKEEIDRQREKGERCKPSCFICARDEMVFWWTLDND